MKRLDGRTDYLPNHGREHGLHSEPMMGVENVFKFHWASRKQSADLLLGILNLS